MGEYRIHAYAQDLSVAGLESLLVGLEVPQLLLSAAGEIERIKRQHDVFLAEKILQADFVVERARRQDEIRGLVANVWHGHKNPSLLFADAEKFFYQLFASA
jgi:hypothetical protein